MAHSVWVTVSVWVWSALPRRTEMRLRRAASGAEGEDAGHPGGGGGERLDGHGRDRARPQGVDGLVVLEEAGVTGPVLVGQSDRDRQGISRRRHVSIMYLSRIYCQPFSGAARIAADDRRPRHRSARDRAGLPPHPG